MFCPKCGYELPQNAKFCPKCGTIRPEQVHSEESIIDNDATHAQKENNAPGDNIVDYIHPMDEPAKDQVTPSEAQKQIKYSDFQRSQTTINSQTRLEQIIQKNSSYYILQFQRLKDGKASKFNWAAFFFNMYFCFYRKCPHLFKKYFLVPLIITLVSTGLLALSFSSFSLTWMAVGAIVALVGYIWYLVNIIRFGKNFNREYYKHIKAILDSGNEKQYGTSLVAALVSVVVYTLLNVLIGIVASLALFSSFVDVDTFYTYEPSTSTFDTSISSDTDISSTSENDLSLPSSSNGSSSNFTIPSTASITYSDFIGTYVGDNPESDSLTITWYDFSLLIDCFGYRDAYFHADVPAEEMIDGNTISFQAYDPDNTTQIYEISLTYVPASNSPEGVDTIYMQSEDLFDMTYQRSLNNLYSDPNFVSDFSLLEGEYHMAHNYTIQMNLWFNSDMSGVNSSNWQGSEPLELQFIFTDTYANEILGDGIAYWWPLSDGLPYFEGELYSSLEPITLEYDGYNFIVNCSALELQEASFFKD